MRVLGDLPAYPDNMAPVGDGTYWIALASPRVALAEKLLPHPNLRRIAAVLPARLQPQPLPYTMAAPWSTATGRCCARCTDRRAAM